ncbi:hypothetical protein TSMEX_006753 [Taenia solium]|eukprot:TsM_001021000 transcript=TsM_001021000 gene=TsM_001021000
MAPEFLKYSFRHKDFTELIYVPYSNMQAEESLRINWKPFQDVIIHLSTKSLLSIHCFHITDPLTNPN